MKSIILLPLLLLGFAQASCPNGCSGHGTCDVGDICTCYPGWGVGGKGGGDCSDRFCPYELAWADGPTETGNNHNYAECANKGVCDRTNGECECFAGYEGKGCGRQTCPDQCSGHGTCEFVKDLKFGKSYHDYYDGSTYDLMGLGTGAKAITDTDLSWDSDRARACVCDGGWTGLKCNMRMCPVGHDIMDLATPATRQKNHIKLIDSTSPASNVGFGTKTFALQFTSHLNETFVTQPIAWNSVEAAFADEIEAALTKLPNKVIDEVSVVVDLTTVGTTEITIEFTGEAVQGLQHTIEVLAEKCDKGCTPLIDGLPNLRSWHATDLSKVSVTDGNNFSFECGNRGKCDYTTGVCKCYDGFAGDACNVFHAAL